MTTIPTEGESPSLSRRSITPSTLDVTATGTRSDGAWLAGFQRWRSMLFVHWEVPAEALRHLVPMPLTIDTYEGRAYVGLIPFDITEARALRALPPIPSAAHFLEINLRTYVVLDGRPGIWFFSLDAQSSLAVLGARSIFGLPYHRAAMRMSKGVGEVTYTSWRTPLPLAKRRPAHLDVTYEVGHPMGQASPGSLEHFLVERYTLYAQHPLLGLLRGEVRHQPYLLRSARVTRLTESLTSAAGIHSLASQLPAVFSEGVDVELSPPLRSRRDTSYFTP